MLLLLSKINQSLAENSDQIGMMPQVSVCIHEVAIESVGHYDGPSGPNDLAKLSFGLKHLVVQEDVAYCPIAMPHTKSMKASTRWHSCPQ